MPEESGFTEKRLKHVREGVRAMLLRIWALKAEKGNGNREDGSQEAVFKGR